MSEKKNTACVCANTSCSRHGDCKACLDYHRKTGSRTCCGKTGNEDDDGKK